MAVRYILFAFATVFLAAAVMRLSRGGRVTHPQIKTWLLVSLIFTLVSAWLSFLK